MDNFKDCYFCDNLIYLDAIENDGYYCKLSGKKYCCKDSEENCCSNYRLITEE